jgi:hypothetical protein
MWPLRPEKEDPYVNQQVETSVMISSKLRQLPTQGKKPPKRWPFQTGGSVCPCSTGRRLESIVAGSPTTRMLGTVSPTGHHGQWSRVRFRISGKERPVPSQLTKD